MFRLSSGVLTFSRRDLLVITWRSKNIIQGRQVEISALGKSKSREGILHRVHIDCILVVLFRPRLLTINYSPARQEIQYFIAFYWIVWIPPLKILDWIRWKYRKHWTMERMFGFQNSWILTWHLFHICSTKSVGITSEPYLIMRFTLF
jgi:hypothetical protein